MKWLFWWAKKSAFCFSGFWLLLAHMGREYLKAEWMTLVSQHGWVDVGGRVGRRKENLLCMYLFVLESLLIIIFFRMLGYYFNEYCGWLDSSCTSDSPISSVKHAINAYWTGVVPLSSSHFHFDWKRWDCFSMCAWKNNKNDTKEDLLVFELLIYHPFEWMVKV